MWGELRPLSDAELARAEAAIDSDDGSLMSFMARVGVIKAVPHGDPAEERAKSLGWVDTRGPTSVGSKIADSCREYRFWEERLRQMPAQPEVPEISAPRLRGRDVVELGSGFGCNLLSLQGQASRAVGVEIEPVYRQLGPVLARKAGLEPPELIGASAHDTGLEPEQFDVMLCLGSLQYMPVREVLSEAARLLRPGGHAYIQFGHFSGYLRALASNPRAHSKRDLVLAPAMLLYPLLGRRLMRPFDPVYPPRRLMCKWLHDAGFETARARGVHNETFYEARRPS